MRDSKRMMGVLALLAAPPVWASDMCELVGMLFLPPVYLLGLAACLAALSVRTAAAARLWETVLGVGAFLALGAVGLSFNGSFHDSKLVHEAMFLASALAVIALLASYVWSFRRLARVSKPTQ